MVVISKKEEEEWTNASGEIWRPEKNGDTIIGILMSRRQGRFQWDNYAIETAEGVRTIFGSAVLQNRMTTVEVGNKVKITFMGMQKNTKNQDMRMYDVQVPKKKQ